MSFGDSKFPLIKSRLCGSHSAYSSFLILTSLSIIIICKRVGGDVNAFDHIVAFSTVSSAKLAVLGQD